MEANGTLIRALNVRLGHSRGTLAAHHSLKEHSRSEALCIKAPKLQNPSHNKPTLGGHTDFCWKRTSGNMSGQARHTELIQVPGHSVCNLGDAMEIFNAGVLPSNLHRVVHANLSTGYLQMPNSPLPMSKLHGTGGP
ncbi:hypothetical protein BJV78DRAFT_1283176 [Lactifluus subvellereus]|nr:hypothetical protein BJV78DRAFT_1283176 [Lactifluus subvellereus]